MLFRSPVGDDLFFELDVEDDDLAVNLLGLSDFELLTYALLLDGLPFAGLDELIANGSQLVTLGQAIALFGLGDHTLEIRVSDRVRTQGASFVNAFVDFTVVPEPSTAVLLLLGLVGLRTVSARGTRG